MGTKDTLATELRVRRDELELSQQDLAGLAGISVSTVQKIEQGLVERPDLDTLDKLARALRVSRERIIRLATRR